MPNPSGQNLPNPNPSNLNPPNLNPPNQAPSHLRSPHGAASVHLDALRGIAAVGVCLSHLRDFFFRDYTQLTHPGLLTTTAYLFTGLGHQWVVVFFVLSGYLVGGSVLRAVAMGRWSWRGYLLNRLTRLYTVLIPALVLGGLLDLAGIHFFGASGIYGGKTGTHELTFAVSTRLHWRILLRNYAFLQGIFVPSFGSNGPLWSLANEFWYYLAFPPLVFVVWRRSSPGRRLLNLILLAAIVVFVRPSIALLGLVWLMGVAIHYLPHLPADNATLRRLLILLAIIASLGTLVWCKQHHGASSDYILGLVITGLIYVLLSCSRTPMPRVYNWTAHALSRSSYTLYLVHVPMLVFLAAWISTRIGQSRWAPTPESVLIASAIFGLVMLYAQVVYFLFEHRTDAIRARIKPWVLGSSMSPRKASLVTETKASWQ
jgi:peptidoglycan/LPS O-acetylase OafA/YrhL